MAEEGVEDLGKLGFRELVEARAADLRAVEQTVQREEECICVSLSIPKKRPETRSPLGKAEQSRRSIRRKSWMTFRALRC